MEGYKKDCEMEAWEDRWERRLAWGEKRQKKEEGEEMLVRLVIPLTWYALL